MLRNKLTKMRFNKKIMICFVLVLAVALQLQTVLAFAATIGQEVEQAQSAATEAVPSGENGGTTTGAELDKDDSGNDKQTPDNTLDESTGEENFDKEVVDNDSVSEENINQDSVIVDNSGNAGEQPDNSDADQQPVEQTPALEVPADVISNAILLMAVEPLEQEMDWDAYLKNHGYKQLFVSQALPPSGFEALASGKTVTVRVQFKNAQGQEINPWHVRDSVTKEAIALADDGSFELGYGQTAQVIAYPNKGDAVAADYATDNTKKVQIDNLTSGESASFTLKTGNGKGTAAFACNETLIRNLAKEGNIPVYEAAAPSYGGLANGIVINGYITYCIDVNKVYPGNGTEFVEGKLVMDQELQEKVGRLLQAGYPVDAFGLSKLQTPYPNVNIEAILSGNTQEVLWTIIKEYEIGKAESDWSAFPYMAALYQYAQTGELPDGFEPDTSYSLSFTGVDANGTLVLKEGNTAGQYMAEVEFTSNRAMTVTSIPEGLTLTVGETMLQVGDILPLGTKVTLQSTGRVKDNITFAYDTYKKLDGDLTVFQPLDGKVQRMVGYATKTETAQAHLALAWEANNGGNNGGGGGHHNGGSNNNQNNSNNNGGNITIPEEEIPGGGLPETETVLPEEEIPAGAIPEVEVILTDEEIPGGPAQVADGPQLPSTGGLGAGLFYGMGTLLACAGLVLRRKTTSQD